MDVLDRIQWWATIGAIISFTVAVLSYGGYYLGWWNHFHESGGFVGSVLGFLLALIALFINATKRQVKAVADAVLEGNLEVRATRQELGGKLDATRQELGGKLDATRQELGGKLDATRHELGGLLREIRDRL